MNRILSKFAVGAVLLGFTLGGCGGGAGTTPDASQVTAAVRASANEMESPHEDDQVVPRFMALLNQLRDVPALAPLFDQYQVPNPIVMNDDSLASGLIAMLQAVKITVASGTVTITNRETDGLIFSGSRSNLAAGEFHPENLPGGTVPAPSPCTYTYSAWGTCQADGTQTRTVASSTPAGCTGTPVLSQACTYVPPTCSTFTYSAWGACQTNNTQTRTVTSSSPAGCTGGTPVLSQACTYVPPACTYTYSAWGACQSNNTQTRTVTASSPTGCAGTPVLSQACTYTPPLDGAALYTSYCSGCHGPLATSNLKGKSISVSSIKSRNMTQGLSDAQLQAIVTAVGP